MLQQATIIFTAQFVCVFLLGTQSQNIRDGKKLAAAVTSLLLGISGWLCTGIISQAYSQGMLSSVFAAFVISGPLAIVASMFVHEHFHKEKK